MRERERKERKGKKLSLFGVRPRELQACTAAGSTREQCFFVFISEKEEEKKKKRRRKENEDPFLKIVLELAAIPLSTRTTSAVSIQLYNSVQIHLVSPRSYR